MIRIAVVGDIGSGKSFISNLFNQPVFNADLEVSDIYKKDKSCFLKIKKAIPNYFSKFPLKKTELIQSILADKQNLKKISNIIHPIVRKRLNDFLKKNKKKKLVILDIPLYFENKLNKKGDIVIYIDAKKKKILKQLKKRKNFNLSLINQLRSLQYSLGYKKKKSRFVIKNDYKIGDTQKGIKRILNKLDKWKK
jgi:dephospho-CoA kinase